MSTEQTRTQHPSQKIEASKSEQPLVSFIIPVYNLPAEMVRQCLRSILALSLGEEEREVIVVDDGSEIPVINELLEFDDQIVYFRQPNRGLSEARNRGLQIARGKYIQFVDGDDKLITASYEHCLDIVRFHHPDIVLFKFTSSKTNEPDFSLPEPVSGEEFMQTRNLRASVWSYVFRKDILHGLRFTTGIAHEDEEFTPQLFLHAKRIFDTPSLAYFYRKRRTSIMNNKSKQHRLHRLNDLEQVLLRLDAISHQLQGGQRAAMERRVAQLTMDYIYQCIRLTRSQRYLEDAISRLQKNGLFPLPDRDYTPKYNLFRRAVATKTGRLAMLLTIPYL